MSEFEPLANSLRPKSAEGYAGQLHLLSPGQPLYQALHTKTVHSMILWGPPGSGKTTLAHLLAADSPDYFHPISAVTAGVKDIKQLVELASNYQYKGRRTILFIDEIHRFSKSQQDYLLPHVESGLLTVIGATTENPSFTLNSALLSRTKIYVLQTLNESTLTQLVDKAIARLKCTIHSDAQQLLVASADGDGRRLLNTIELSWQLAQSEESPSINLTHIQNAVGSSWRQFDRQGEHFYDQISAMHKSMRGSDPDAALYWLCRMLDGGCDPRYLARRIIRMASEDVGNADPKALSICLDAAESYERLGSPEGELMLAQALVYISATPKSNALYTAFNQATSFVKNNPSHPVPLRFRNAPTQLMKDLDYGKDYKYAHDQPDGLVIGEHYFPDEIPAQNFYQPLNQGVEARIKQRLDQIKEKNAHNNNHKTE